MTLTSQSRPGSSHRGHHAGLRGEVEDRLGLELVDQRRAARRSSTMSSSRSSACWLTRAASPEERSSTTVTSWPSDEQRVDDVGADEAGSAGHDCAIAHAAKSIRMRRRRCRSSSSSTASTDWSIRSSTRMSAALAGQASADGGAAEDDRDVGVVGAQVAQRDLDGFGARRARLRRARAVRASGSRPSRAAARRRGRCRRSSGIRRRRAGRGPSAGRACARRPRRRPAARARGWARCRRSCSGRGWPAPA